MVQAALWTMLDTDNVPVERHENGFVAYNGKLYLIGGRGLKRVQIFEPATNTWTDGAFPPFQMHHFQAVVYNDLIYVVGAYTGSCCTSEFGVANVWTYNPLTDEWTERHEIPVDRRRGSTGVVVYNEKFYIVGGLDGGHGSTATSFNWFDEYDPATGQWKILPNAPRKRDHFHAVLSNGKMYLMGGRDSSDPSITRETVEEVDVYDFNTGTWSTLGTAKNIPTPRGGTASVLFKGEILVIGGETFDQTLAHKTTEAFDPIAESWRTLNGLVVGRHGTQAAILDGAVFVAAGSAQTGGEPELDSIEKYEDTTVEIVSTTQSLSPGWNLAGLPLSPLDGRYDAVYAGVDLEAGQLPMTWNGAGYETTTDLSTGTAYWIKIEDDAPPAQDQVVSGISIDALQVQLAEGWNMISGPSCDNVILLGSSTSPTGAIPEGTLYSFDNGYVQAFNDVFDRGRLDQGVGYWVYASAPAVLTLSCGGGKSLASRGTPPAWIQAEQHFGLIEVRDAAGGQRRMLFGASLGPDDSPLAFNLPPRLYGPYFDARFGNNRRLVEATEGHLKLQAAQYPLTITFIKTPAGRPGVLHLTETGHAGTARTHTLSPGQSVSLESPAAAPMSFQFVDDAPVEPPATFVLHGNYPNPFNPTTRIAFDLPQPADVTITIVDLTGRERYRAVMPNLPAGTGRSVSIDAGGWAAGTYLYRVQAQTADGLEARSGTMTLLK